MIYQTTSQFFCIIKSNPPRNASKIFCRDNSKFNNKIFLDDINLIDWQEILKTEKNLHEKVQDAIVPLSFFSVFSTTAYNLIVRNKCE